MKTPREKMLADIENIVKRHGLSLKDIFTTSRLPWIVACRNECMRHIRNEYGYSLPKIGKMFKRDHSAVYHSINAYEFKHGMDTEGARKYAIKLQRAKDRHRAVTDAASALQHRQSEYQPG